MTHTSMSNQAHAETQLIAVAALFLVSGWAGFDDEIGNA